MGLSLVDKLEILEQAVPHPEKHYKPLRAGLYIREESIDYLAKMYAMHKELPIATPSSHALSRARQELLEGSNPYYLISNGQCWHGYLLPGNLPNTPGIGGNHKLQNSATILHPSDPRARNNTTLQLLDKPGIIAQLSIEKRELYISPNTLETFSQIARHSKRTITMFNQSFPTMYDCLHALQSLLKGSRRIQPKMLPRTYQRLEKGTEYRANHGWYFGIRGNMLKKVTVYEKGQLPLYNRKPIGYKRRRNH